MTTIVETWTKTTHLDEDHVAFSTVTIPAGENQFIMDRGVAERLLTEAGYARAAK